MILFASTSRRMDESWHTALSSINLPRKYRMPTAACFYVQLLDNDAYAPTHLAQRTALELTGRVAAAIGMDSTKILRSIWLCDQRL